MQTRGALTVILFVALSFHLSCKGGGGGSKSSTSGGTSGSASQSSSCIGPNVLPSNPNPVISVFPVKWENISNVVGFGTHGSNHPEGVTKIYIYPTQSGKQVYAPSAGIARLDSRFPEHLFLDVSCEVTVQFDHISGISVSEGQSVAAGDPVGKTYSSALDFNVFNTTTNNGFPSSWPSVYNQATCPLNHFSDELKTEFLTRWSSTYLLALDSFWPEKCEPVYCQNINANQANTLWGVWFNQGTVDQEHGLLITVTDCNDSWAGGSKNRVRMKGMSGYSGTFEYFIETDTDQGNGERCMTLRFATQPGDSTIMKYMRYKFNSASEIKVEISQNACPASFSPTARVYDREYVEPN